jgi:alpha-L-fucosidase
VDVDARIVTAALAAITSRGGALMLGTAQGGRGVTVTAFLDGERAKDYAATVEELEEMLLEVVDSLGSPAEDLRSEFGLASSD